MEILVFLLFTTGFVLYALGLSSFGKNSLHAQTFFHLSAFLFILFFYKRFQKQDFKALKIPLLCFGIVIVCGFLTYFNPILPRTFSQVLSAINSNIIGLVLLYVIGFVWVLYTRRVYLLLFFIVLAFLCVLEVTQTIEIAKATNNHRRVPFYFQEVYAYNIWLLLPTAFCIGGIFAFKNIGLKILCVVGVYFCLLAMLANAERSFLVAFVVMIVGAFLLYRYKFKKIILPVFFLALLVSGIYGYNYSKTLPERYNFAYMLENFWVVINTKPIEMGKYDNACFSGWNCSQESKAQGKDPITWEHSSLVRLAMSKSTFLAVLDNPLKPHIVGVFQIGEYLWHYYNLKNHQNRVYMAVDNAKYNGYNSPHNLVVSLLLSYGIIGFGAICVFLFLLFRRTRAFMNAQSNSFIRFITLSFCLLLCGICAQCFFDVIYNVILHPLFLIFGFIQGLILRKDLPHNLAFVEKLCNAYKQAVSTLRQFKREQRVENYGKKVRLKDSLTIQENKEKEQRALKVSMYCALLLAIFGIGFGQLVKSSAIIFDGIVCLVSVALGFLSVVTSRYIYKEDDDIFQYGYVRFEPMVNFFKSAVLLAVCVYALLSGVHSVIKGGYSLELGSAVIYTICAFVICLGIFAYTHFFAERLDSELLYVDRTEWLIDCALYFGAIVAFGCVYLFDPQQKSAISHYIDPLLLIFLSFGLAFTPLRIMVANFKDLVMVAPPELDSQITQIMQDLSKEYGFSEYDTHVAKSGRFFMIEVNILETHGLSINAKELDIIREKIQNALKLPSYRIWLLVSLTANPKWL